MQARIDNPGDMARAVLHRMQIVVLAAVVLGAPLTAWAQVDGNTAPPVVPEANSVETARGPYVARITGNDVYIRSGPGTNFYRCGKLYENDRVQVVEAKHGWSCIVPPPGCFSWISMQYVSIDLDNPTMGIVTGNGVGVYAGSDYVEPMHSTSKQVTVNRGQNVRLLGEEKDDYYKIAPPDGAYLWVSSQFVQAREPDVPQPAVGVEPNAPSPEPAAPPVAAQTATESELLDQYYALSKLVKDELTKPVSEQDYADVKKKLNVLAENEAAGRAARYAAFTLKQVERFELACTVAREIELQSQELEKVTEKIDAARAERLAQIKNLGQFAVIGKLASSSIYQAAPTKRYRILDAVGKTICYIEGTGAAVGRDLSQYIGKKVGVVGKIRPHEATARALITFTDVVPIVETEQTTAAP
jgi:hypothetical protein